MPPKVDAGGWDDDDDTPLAFVAAATAPKAQPPAKQDQQQTQSKSAQQQKAAKSPLPKESAADSSKKKTKEVKKEVKKKELPAKGDEWIDDRLARSSSKKSLFDPDTIKKNMPTIMVVLVGILIVYFKAVSHGVNFSAIREMEDPFQTLGVSSGSSDAEIKKVYRKLSLSLHPDKNPNQSEEDVDKFNKITQAYKILSDPEKRRRWMNNENPDFTPLPSDTETLTDRNADEMLTDTSAWLILAYADWSNECWELAEHWEKMGKDLGRYVRVGRFNFEKEPGLAKRFNVMSVPMIYTFVDGVRTTFFGDPTHANVTMFVTKSLADTVTVVRDANGGAFLEDQDKKTKVMLFAQQGMVKLRLVFRSFAARFKNEMDFAEAQINGAEALRELYGIDREPALVFVREKEAKVLKYTGKMTQQKLQQMFEQHQYHSVPRLSSRNYKDLCGAGSWGRQPCVLYLHDPSVDQHGHLEEAKAVFRNASALELTASLQVSPARMATAFAWVDLATQPGLRKALARRAAVKVVALDAKTETLMPFEGADMLPETLVSWSQGFGNRMEGDFDHLAGPLTLTPESPHFNWKTYLRSITQHMMTTVAVLATCLLWYAVQNLIVDMRENRNRERNVKSIGKARAKALESEKMKLSKWETIEKQNKEAAAKKKQEAEDKERKRVEAAREAADAKAAQAREAERAKQTSPPRSAAAPAPQRAAAPPPKPRAPTVVSDTELRRSIASIVQQGDLSTLTKRAVRESLQAKYPDQDLLARKDLIMSEIEEAVKARVATGA
mmetsp:Transcript_12994/g.25950  ORF Transcript_12994/g.25950 Transcript_12994/m.25950 type:complete len:781 (+) Transcript_12994:66-2408(+)|eukprot:CAMPEP_0181308656 /NCGR_PEP_ID=MMETSP1101-20121128/11585_1 /TAXON_ID=46948 /ORGANISM="Rhodomonas abbreviata, Strain Caron Lab Isolate" /LENGTH=780 /DNA_ID=CAMNT_0023415065 /DNA_START=58 /DNA_END=2400 /DNA_ORIENTATION=+